MGKASHDAGYISRPNHNPENQRKPPPDPGQDGKLAKGKKGQGKRIQRR